MRTYAYPLCAPLNQCTPKTGFRGGVTFSIVCLCSSWARGSDFLVGRRGQRQDLFEERLVKHQRGSQRRGGELQLIGPRADPLASPVALRGREVPLRRQRRGVPAVLRGEPA